jgi:hypothetical protein
MDKPQMQSIVDLADEVARWQDHFQQWADSKLATPRMVRHAKFLKEMVVRFRNQFDPQVQDCLDAQSGFQEDRELTQQQADSIDKASARKPSKIKSRLLTPMQAHILKRLRSGHDRLIMRAFSGYCYNGRLLRESTESALIVTGELVEVRTVSPKGFRSQYLYHYNHVPTSLAGRKILSAVRLQKEIR